MLFAVLITLSTFLVVAFVIFAPSLTKAFTASLVNFFAPACANFSAVFLAAARIIMPPIT